MARKQEWQFSESESLEAESRGASFSEGEERLPAWAREMSEAADADAPSLDAPKNAGAEMAEAPIPALEEADEAEETDGNKDEEARKEAAQEAWDREATRVESGMNRRAAPKPTDEPEDKNTKKSAKAAKKKAKAEKKRSKNKKKKGKQDERKSFLRTMCIVLVCGLLFLMVGMMVLSNFVSLPILALPRRIVTTIVSPVQRVFSSVSDSVANYLRTLKIRGNLEYEYDQLLIRLDDMANDTATLEEIRRENEELRSMLFEHQQTSHQAMNPIGAQVIGTAGNNYFSSLTLNVGVQDGVGDYMAVVSSGGLVGVTYNTKDHQCDVRCIIDSDCTVAGLVQSSRDQGSVKGTLGSTGEPICRMYYLPDNSLPRPGDVVVTSGVGLEFPKGIPIGYIRESTRGMEDNKSYVVLEPVVDFQHLEYVTVYRYRPSYAESAQNRTSSSQTIVLEPLITARPVPAFEMEGLSDFMIAVTATPAANASLTSSSPEDGQATPTPRPTPTPGPGGTELPPNLEYVATVVNGETPTPSPRPTFTPTPSPVPTQDPGGMTEEVDE